MAQSLLEDLVTAHRILVAQGVLDAFGHVSTRDPDNFERFWLARAVAPGAVSTEDMLPFDLQGRPAVQTDAALYVERFIHSAIYRLRPDVYAVCHHHAASLMPFCLTARPLVPVSQSGAFMGGEVPVWDSAAEFGDTGMLITDDAQAVSLAKSLANGPLVLMRGHGATVVGASVREVVFRAVHSCREADSLRRAALLGEVHPLSPGEIEKARHVRAPILERCWSHWLATMNSGSEKGTA